MEPVKPKANTACLVARFQINRLHSAHKELIDTALKNHPRVIIILGLSHVRGSINDPLDYQTRKQMLLEEYPPEKYPNLSIGYVEDQASDEVWSKNLDKAVGFYLGPNDSVVLYGGRDSFINYYKGKYPTLELEATLQISASEIRRQVANAPIADPAFRAGVIWASYQRFPTVYSTVDIALVDFVAKRILLGRKEKESLYRFPGGFVDPILDNSFEDAAKRELREETGINVLDVNYIGSRKISDWRYRNNPTEKIFTHLYVAKYINGPVKADDDLAECKWFSLNELNETVFVPEHAHLFEMLNKEFIACGDKADTTQSK